MGFFSGIFNSFITPIVSKVNDETTNRLQDTLNGYRERLGRNSLTGLQGASSRTADEWQRSKLGTVNDNFFLNTRSRFQNAFLEASKVDKTGEAFNRTWNSLDRADKFEQLKSGFDFRNTPFYDKLSPYEKAYNNYYSPYRGADGRTFDQLSDKEKDNLFRDQTFDLEIGRLYERARTSDGVYHYNSLPAKLQEYEKKRLNKVNGTQIDEETQDFKGNDVFPYDMLEGKERDAILSSVSIENAFKDRPDYFKIKQLHPRAQLELYNDPEFANGEQGMQFKDTDLESDIETEKHPILGGYRQLRQWLAHKADKMLSLEQNGATAQNSLIHTFLTGEGTDVQKAFVWMAAAIATKDPVRASFITNIDWNDASKNIFGQDAEAAMRKAERDNIEYIDNDIQRNVPIVKSQLENAALGDDTLSNQVNNLWEDFTKDHTQWQAFKGQDMVKTLITNQVKKQLLAETFAAADMFGEAAAQKYFNDKLTNLLADAQGSSAPEIVGRAISTKTSASMAEGILSVGVLMDAGQQMLGTALGAATGDDDYFEWGNRGGRRIKNRPLGLDADGEVLAWPFSLKYWDGVDKMGTWDPSYIENVNYGIYDADGHPTNEFYEFKSKNIQKYIDQGVPYDEAIEKVKEDYIKEQENTGIYNGTGVSEFVRIQKVGEEHSLLSLNTLEFGIGMIGYVLGQKGLRGLNSLADKGVNALGRGTKAGAVKLWNKTENTAAGRAMRTAGKKFGEYLRPVIEKIPVNPVSLLHFKNGLKHLGQKWRDFRDINMTSASISFGYGFGVMEDMQRQGLDSLRSGIESAMNKAEEMLQGEEKYGISSDIWDPRLNGEVPGKIGMEDAFKNRYREFRNQSRTIDKYYSTLAENYIKELYSSGQQLTEEQVQAIWQNFAYKASAEQQELREKFIDNELKKYHAEDLKKLRNESIKAFYTQAAIEQVRMANFMPKYNRLVFRDIAQRRGNLANRLIGEDTKLGKKLYTGKLASHTSTIDPTTGKLVMSRNTGKLRNIAEKTSNALRQIYSGAYSNYMDDVTSAFTKGYYLNDFNDYLASKYNNETWGYAASNMSNFLAGMNEAQGMMTDSQALYDAFVGGFGTSMSFLPFGIGPLVLHSAVNGSFKKGWNAFTTDAQGRKMTTTEILGKMLQNGVLSAIGEVNEANLYKDKSIDNLNKKYGQLYNTVKDEYGEEAAKALLEASTLISWTEGSDNITDEILDIQDAKAGLGFTLSQIIHDSIEILGEENNPYAELLGKIRRMSQGMTDESIEIPYEEAQNNQQTEQQSQPETTAVERRKNAFMQKLEDLYSSTAKIMKKTVDAMVQSYAGKAITSTGRVVGQTMQKGLDFAEESLESSLEKKDGIKEDDLDRFIKEPVNQDAIAEVKEQARQQAEEEFSQQMEYNDQEGFIRNRVQNAVRRYAAERITRNAQKFLDIYKNFQKNLKVTRQYFGKNEEDERDAALQMAYNMTMYNVWKKRLRSINKRIEGQEEWNNERSDVVAFRNIGFINKQISNLKTEIKNSQERAKQYNSILKEVHKARKSSNKEQAYNAMQRVFNELGLNNAKEVEEFRKMWNTAVEGKTPGVNRYTVLRDVERWITTLEQGHKLIVKHRQNMLNDAQKSKANVTKNMDPELVKQAEEAYNQFSTLQKPEISRPDLYSTKKSEKFLYDMEKRHSNPEQKANEKEESKPVEESKKSEENKESKKEEKEKETKEEVKEEVKEETKKEEKPTVPLTGLDTVRGTKKTNKAVQEQVDYATKFYSLRGQMHSVTPVITAEEIPYLNPADRAKLLTNPQDFGTEQNAEIQRYLESLWDSQNQWNNEEEGTESEANEEKEESATLQDVIDAGILQERLDATDILLKQMMKSPAAFAHYSQMVRNHLVQAQLDRFLKSSQFKSNMENLDAIISIQNSIPTIKGTNPLNNQNIVGYALQVISRNRPEGFDWNDVAQALQIYDQHVDEIQKLIDESEDVTREIFGKETLPMVSNEKGKEGEVNSIRDLVELAINKYNESKKDKEDRKTHKNAPERTESYTHEQQLQDEDAIEEGKSEEEKSKEDEKKEADEEIKEELDEIIDKEENEELINEEENLIEEEPEEEKTGKPEEEPGKDPETGNKEYDDTRKRSKRNVRNVHNNAEKNLEAEEKESLLGKKMRRFKSAIISLINPFRFREKRKNTPAADIYRRWKEIVPDINRTLSKLGEISDMPASKRPNVYFYVPKEWSQYILSDSEKFKAGSDLPIIVVVEDDQGTIKVADSDGTVKSYTAIGLAPSGNLYEDNDVEKIPLGSGRWGKIRSLGLATLENLKDEDKGGLISDKDGYVHASINSINFYTPESLPNSDAKKSIRDIAYSYLKYNGDESVFDAEEIQGEGNNLYYSFVRNFFKNLRIRTRDVKTSEGTKKSKELRYKISNKETNSLIVSHYSIHELSYKVDGEIVGIKEALEQATKDKTVADQLLGIRGNSYFLRRLSGALYNALKYAIDESERKGIGITNEQNGEVFVSEGFANDLTGSLASQLGFYLFTPRGRAFDFQVGFTSNQVEDAEYITLTINQKNSAKENSGTVQIRLDKNGVPRLTNSTVASIIKNLLYETEGNGDNRNVDILIPYKDIEEYQKILNGTSDKTDSEQKAIMSKLEEYFNDGIFTMFHEDFKQGDVTLTFSPELMTKDESNENAVVIETTTESDNASSHESKDPAGEKPPLPPTAESFYNKMKAKIEQIKKDSKKRFEEWKARHQGFKGTSMSHSFAATSVAAALSGDYFDENSPWALPSRTFGNTVDSFIREYLKIGKELDRSKYAMLNDACFESLTKHLDAFKEGLISRGETVIVTDEIIVNGNTKVKVTIDGETKTLELPGSNHFDMITLDVKGKIHIYDFKTFRNDLDFIDNIQQKYGVQLNTYRNALMEEYGKDFEIDVQSLHIIPIELNYADPNEVQYSLDNDGRLLKDGEPVIMDEHDLKFGINMPLKTFILRLHDDNITSKTKEFIVSILEGLEFTEEQINFIVSKKSWNLPRKREPRHDTALRDEINEKIARISMMRTHSLKIPINPDTSINFDELTERGRQEVQQYINKYHNNLFENEATDEGAAEEAENPAEEKGISSSEKDEILAKNAAMELLVRNTDDSSTDGTIVDVAVAKAVRKKVEQVIDNPSSNDREDTIRLHDAITSKGLKTKMNINGLTILYNALKALREGKITRSEFMELFDRALPKEARGSKASNKGTPPAEKETPTKGEVISNKQDLVEIESDLAGKVDKSGNQSTENQVEPAGSIELTEEQKKSIADLTCFI